MKFIYLLSIILAFTACTSKQKHELNPEVLASLGAKYKNEFADLAKFYENQLEQDTANVEAHLGRADSYILLHVFGYEPRENTLPQVREAFQKANAIDSLHSDVIKLGGILNFLDREWLEAEQAFKKAIALNAENLSARHWYALWLSAMDRFDEAMAHSDTIMSMDTADNFLISRASFMYFQYRFEEMKPLMEKDIQNHPEQPWAYDWLGMAYNGLEEHEASIDTYFKAFNLSDGTVEVGGGLGHALGDAGEYELAKQMADYYDEAAKDRYLPACQRAFIHIGIGEYDKALDLLEQAYEENSWFLLFMKTEHWYNPIRKDPRFVAIMDKMNFPE